jgi:glycerophosphoryl diester phosphodiesterase
MRLLARGSGKAVAANSPWPYPLWVAHRGAGKLAPENTLAAFRIGAAHGYRAFECDMKLSADDVPFLLHDTSLERTTSGQGVAGQLPWSALSLLDAGAWHSRQFAGEPMPSLEAIAAFVKANAFQLNIEIKPTPGVERKTGFIVARDSARLWQAADVPPLLSSFQPEALEGAREGAAQLPRALLLDTPWEGWFETATAIGCAAVVTNYKVMSAEILARLHAAGLRGLVYTVNDPAAASRLCSIGIDGIITDAVDQFAPGV